ncbi:MAG: aldolase/citrate lyase family protein [Rhodobacteraceae bacterium]|nr:aldolase/citrate lyase family protein [Paracoccaceae bacterium]MCY4197509.1 aldolase/citrate lyase family protein [Paracoccaceae bacterium]MCY4327100.1 aldolase/citrate lyase family protein [Paracoccaceae bacterium]
MISNPIRELKAQGKPVVNGWLTMGSSFAAEIQAELGFDSLTADMQHGLLDYRDALAIFSTLRASGVAPLSRVPWLEPGIIMKTLDAGALGIICPMINNREQAETLVSYSHYPPQGSRSFGPIRASVSVGSDYVEKANDTIVCLAMVETAEAYEKRDEIVSTPGLDGIYIGPSDLALGLHDGRMGVGFDRREKEILDPIKRILESAKRHHVIAGIHCGSAEYAADAIGWGFDLVTLSSDARLLVEAATARLAKIRSLLGDEDSSPDGASGAGGY